MSAVLLDRTSLGKTPLQISADGTWPYSLTVGGLGRPAVAAKTTYAGDSPWVHGSTPIAVVREQTSLPLTVLVQAASSSALDTALRDLDEALWQFTYNVSVIEGSITRVWLASPASYGIDNAVVSSDNVAGHYEVWQIDIPIYPIQVA